MTFLSHAAAVSSLISFFFNYVVMQSPVLNFMLIRMAFSATFSNMISEERLEQLMHSFNPILGIAMIVVILNLGVPLDYHLIMRAGIYTAVYILSRAAGQSGKNWQKRWCFRSMITN